MMFGIFVYSFQGQLTLPLAFQGLSKFAWQTVGNVIALITGIIAAGLYGNIGISKYYYNRILFEWEIGRTLTVGFVDLNRGCVLPHCRTVVQRASVAQ